MTPRKRPRPTSSEAPAGPPATNDDAIASPPAANRWQVAAAVGWLVGFCIYFYSFTLPNSNPRVARLDLWANLHLLLLDLIDPLPLEGAPPAGVAFLPQRIDLVLTAGLILTAAWCLGGMILRMLGLRGAMTTAERIVFGTGLGLSAYSLLTLLLGLAGLLSRALFCGLFLASFAGAYYLLRRDTGKPIPLTRENLGAWDVASYDTPQLRLLLACGVMAFPFLWCTLLGSLLPSTDFDVKEYHLQGPKEFFQDGRVHFLQHNVYTSFPFLTEMLSLLAMVVRGDWFRGALAGKAVLMTFGPLTALAVYAAGRRWFGPTAGLLAALVHMTTPWTYRISIIAYAEGGLTFFLFAALFAVMRCLEKQNSQSQSLRWAILAGLLAGSGMACKYPGLVSVVVPLGLAAVIGRLWHVRSVPDTSGAPAGKPARLLAAGTAVAIPFAVGVAVTIGPWLTKNLMETGNPVYPLLYSVFGGTDWNTELDAKWKRAHSPDHHQLYDLGVKFIDVTAKSDWLSPLLYGLAALSLLRVTGRCRIRWLWCYVAYLFLTWWVLTHRIDRFWVPMIPVVSLLAGIGADWNRGTGWTWVRNGVMTAAALFNLAFITTPLCGYNSYLIDMRQAELIAPSIQLLNRLELPADQRILCVGEAAVFDARFRPVYNTVFDTSIFQAWCSDMPDGFTDRMTPLKEPADIHAKLREERIAYIFVNWSEILRYRETYGYTDFANPEVFHTLQEQGVLGRPLPENPGLVPWDDLSDKSQAEVEKWAPSLRTTLNKKLMFTSSQVFPVKP